MKKCFHWLKTSQASEDEEKMRKIIKNCRKNNANSSKKDCLGLCRVSFISTYGKIFSGDLDALWDKTK